MHLGRRPPRSYWRLAVYGVPWRVPVGRACAIRGGVVAAASSAWTRSRCSTPPSRATRPPLRTCATPSASLTPTATAYPPPSSCTSSESPASPRSPCSVVALSRAHTAGPTGLVRLHAGVDHGRNDSYAAHSISSTSVAFVKHITTKNLLIRDGFWMMDSKNVTDRMPPLVVPSLV